MVQEHTKAPRVAFVYWGVAPHPRREQCLNTVGADFFKIPISKIHPFGEVLYSLALSLKIVFKSYDVIFVDSIIAMETAYFAKTLFRSKAKIVFYLVDPTLHKPTLGEGFRKKMYLGLTKKVDGWMAPSETNEEAIRAFFPNVPVGYGPPFLYRGSHAFDALTPDLKARRFIFIGSNRVEKNLPNVISGYRAAQKKTKMPQIILLGHGTDQFNGNGVLGLGHGKIEPHMEKATFLIHPAVFDSAPNVIIEAMAAGVIPVVSVYCGNYTAVAEIDKRLVMKDISADAIEKKFIELMSLSDTVVRGLSKKARLLSKKFSKEKGLKTFKESFEKLYLELSSKK